MSEHSQSLSHKQAGNDIRFSYTSLLSSGAAQVQLCLILTKMEVRGRMHPLEMTTGADAQDAHLY